MKVISQISLALLASALVTVSQGAAAQDRRADDVRWSRTPSAREDRRSDNDDRWRRDEDRRRRDDERWRREEERRRRDDERWRRDDNRRNSRARDIDWIRRQRQQHVEWCRRHRNDRRCAELYQRGANWCWDVNHDRRCDNVDFRRRDSRGVVRNDRGPDWERWLRSSGVDVDALLDQSR